MPRILKSTASTSLSSRASVESDAAIARVKCCRGQIRSRVMRRQELKEDVPASCQGRLSIELRSGVTFAVASLMSDEAARLPSVHLQGCHEA